MRIQPEMLEQMLFPRLDPKAIGHRRGQGPARLAGGRLSGIAVFDADRAEKMGRGGEKVILVREETKPEDIHGFFASQGILTSRGGKTSHAAVVARGMGKPCVAGAEGIHVDVRMRQAIVGDSVFREGDVITIDGSTGKVYLGEVPTTEAEFSQELVTLLSWADEVARLQGHGQRRHPGRCRPRPQVRRHGHRPVPHRAHVQRHRAAAHRGGDDRGRDPGGPPVRPGQAAAASSAATSGTSSR
jgi:phosphohistidine swiveling domain-containing protein